MNFIKENFVLLLIVFVASPLFIWYAFQMVSAIPESEHALWLAEVAENAKFSPTGLLGGLQAKIEAQQQVEHDSAIVTVRRYQAWIKGLYIRGVA